MSDGAAVDAYLAGEQKCSDSTDQSDE